MTTPRLLLTDRQVDSLFQHLRQQLQRQTCDDTLRFTAIWARDAGMSASRLADALSRRQAICDCKVVMLLRHAPELPVPYGMLI